MTDYYATWLADALRWADLNVIETTGWKSDGRRGGEPLLGTPKFVIVHHTAGPKTGDHPSIGVVKNGRPGLGGPLSNLFLDRDGDWNAIAAGKCNHAGQVLDPDYQNGWTIGIEAEAAGVMNAPNDWPDVQMRSYVTGVAALLWHLKLDATKCLAHKEIASPKGRKSDPNFDMTVFRVKVARQLSIWNEAASRDKPRPAPVAFTLTRILKNDHFPARKMRGKDVERVAVALVKNGEGLPKSKSTRTASGYDGIFGSEMERAVRSFQKRKNLTVDGRVGPNTARALGGKFTG